jgi:uncharacterized SAM-binding protein YcdF (DUF218 family)
MISTTISHAQRLWAYMCSPRAHGDADAIVVCCSYDLRVCDYACELIRSGVAPRLVVTGGLGNWTRHLWSFPEAHVFSHRALANGLDPGCILMEDRATNFGENIAFTRELLPEAQRIVFVTKPNAVLRVSLIIPVQWPEITAFVDSPELAFPEDVSNMIGVIGVIHEMVGDIDRIMKYPDKGFQIPHQLPPSIMESWNALVGEGFNRHLVTGSLS